VAPHPANEAWMRAVGTNQFRPFNFFSSSFMRKFSLGNQLFGFLYSFFIPSAKMYLLTSTGCAISVLFKKKILGSTVIAINSDTFYRDLRAAKGIRKWYMLWLAKHIDGMVSSSYMMERLARPFISCPHEVVYPFCDVKKFSKVKPNYRSSHICSIGTGINTKGTDILFDAFEIYQKKFPESKLYVCGPQHPIKHLLVPKNTVLPGRVDPARFLSKSGIYINTSRHESFGVNIIEAMCAGLPTLVTDRCGAAEFLRKVDPWLVTSLDPKEIAQKAISLQKNVRKKIMLGKKARKMGIKFTKKRSVEEFKTAFRKIMKKIK